MGVPCFYHPFLLDVPKKKKKTSSYWGTPIFGTPLYKSQFSCSNQKFPMLCANSGAPTTGWQAQLSKHIPVVHATIGGGNR